MYKLMIVDDEPLTREYMKNNVNLLHERWMCAGEAGDGEEALELMNSGEAFDLIVTDIKMPGMSGLELAHQLVKHPSSPRIIILSGYDEFSMAKEAMQYGVNDYLLKPLVKEELISVLDKIANQLEADRSKNAAFQTLISLSEESRAQVARNFLHAVVSDNHIEIKMLYPILYRLKISLLEAEGAIMIVDLDESQLLERDISLSDRALFRYIIHQTATELTAINPDMILFIDNEERTVMHVPGEDESDVINRCQLLFEQLSKTILDMTGLQLWGAVGSSEIEVLQLNMSYRKASQALKYRLFAEKHTQSALYIKDTRLDTKVKRLNKSLAAIHTAKADNQDIQLHSALQGLVSELEPLDRRRVLVLGSYMMNRLISHFVEEKDREAVLAPLRLLKQQPKTEVYNSEEVVLLYRRMLECLNTAADNPTKEDSSNEHEIVTKVKEYILTHFAEPLSLALIAEKMNVSAGYLSSLFHQNTQESYIKFLTRVRMEHAASLLRAKTSVKVYDIAEKVGYLSVKHFSYVFKQHFGIPPGEYQEKAVR